MTPHQDSCSQLHHRQEETTPHQDLLRRTRDLLLLLGLRSRTTPTRTTRQTPAHSPRLSALACRSRSARRGDFEYLTKFQAHP